MPVGTHRRVGCAGLLCELISGARCLVARLFWIFVAVLISIGAHVAGTTFVFSSARSLAAREVFRDPHLIELAEAAAAGDANDVRGLVAQGVDINARGDTDTLKGTNWSANGGRLRASVADLRFRTSDLALCGE